MAENYRQQKQKMKEFVEKNNMEFEMSKISFSEKHPEPKKKLPEINIKFWLALISAISAGALSGMRIFDRFYSVAYNGSSTHNSQFSIVEAFFGIGAVNVVIVALSFGVAFATKKMSEKSMHIGLWVAVTISAVAGLGQSFYGLGMIQVVGVFDWVLAFSLAAVTALEYLSGDMLGVEYFTWYQEKKKLDNEYIVEHKKWETEALRNFSVWKMQFANWDKQQQKLENNIQNSPQNTPELSEPTEQNFNNNESVLTENKSEKIKMNKEEKIVTKNSEILQLIKRVYEETGNIPTVKNITQLLANEKIEQGELLEKDLKQFLLSKKGSVSQQLSKWTGKNVDVKSKSFIKGFIKKNKALPTIQDICNETGISNVDANYYLSEFLVKNQIELLKYKIIGQEDIDDAMKILSVDSDD